MSNVLVVGGAGYIGSHMVAELRAEGINPIVLDNLSTGWQKAVPKEVKLYKGSKGDKKLVSLIFTENKVDAVIDFAAYSQAGESMEKPGKYFENNVAETISLLNTMIEFDCLRYVLSSTAAVYGNPVKNPIEEGDEKKPINPYGESKLIVEKLLKWYDEAYRMKWAALRYFNAAGAHDSGDIGEAHSPESHLMPIIIEAAFGRRKYVKIYGVDYDIPNGDGTCVRDYIHVMDLAKAHTLALQKLIFSNESNVYNLGNGNGFSVKEIVKRVAKLTEKEIEYVSSEDEVKVEGRKLFVMEVQRRPGDPPVLVASSKKAAEQLGWEQKYGDINAIIASAIKWHSRYPNGYEDF